MSQPASPTTTPGQLTPSHDRPTLRLIAGLMAASAAMLVIASIVHFGATIGGLHDPFRDAAVPEAVIASVLACGVAAVVVRLTKAWGIALGATVFAVAGFLVGLRFTLFGEGGPRMGDVAYHAGGLALLLTTLALLLSPAGRRARS